MYEQFFNLRTKPFELVPDPQFLYPSKSHKKAIMYLDYGIREKVGFILLTGEIGSGKTTVLRNLINGLTGKATLSKVCNTVVSSTQLIALINEDFGLQVTGKDRIAMLRDLNDFLVDQYARGNQSILVIDEAQNLSLKLLEEVRLLSNLETDKQKLLQIILVGQPELRKTLARPELIQLKQRISISCHIHPLTLQETEQYILHRLETAGSRNAISFQDGTFQTIYDYSRGIPRLINIICDFLMLSAFVENKHELDRELVTDVVGEIGSEHCHWDEATLPDSFSGGVGPSSLISQRVENLEKSIVQNALTVEKVVQMVSKLLDQSHPYSTAGVSELAGLSTGLSNVAGLLEKLEARISTLEENKADAPDQKKRGIWSWKAN
jgi:putative secretion ATPase (PEP-CTERM system associated)